jgi:hypothetical protein
MHLVELLKNKSGYLYSTFGGLGLFFLKFLSLKVLISNITFDNYPFALALGGICVFVLNQINKKFDSSYALNIFYLVGSSLLIFVNQQGLVSLDSGHVTTMFAGFSFAFFMVTSQFAEVILKELTIVRSSSIKNSKFINKLILFEEIGLLIAATSMILFKSIVPISLILATGLIPLGIMFVTTRVKKQSPLCIEEEKIKKTESIFSHSFTVYAILLVSTIFLIKQLYSYGAYIGFKQLDLAGSNFESVFASINIIQTLVIFGIIGSKIFFQKRNISWNKGVKLFLNAQFVIFSVLVFISSPILLVCASALRKSLAHTILNESLKLLHINFPINIKNQIQHITNSYAGLGSYLIVAGLSFLMTRNYIGLDVVWAFAIVCTALAVFFRTKLLNALLEFQITNILQKNVYEAVNSCYSLAHIEAKVYAPSLGSLLQKNPRPMLTKAIIYTLGEMQNPISIDLLIQRFKETEREDIQLTIIQALIKFKSHHVDLFLLECLEDMILSQVSLGEIRRSVFESITSKVQNIAIPMALRLIRNNSENHRVLANAILIIGELAIHKNDISLYELLVHYTDEKYPRRIRSNAFLYIYKHKNFQEQAMGGISSFIVSSDEYDRSAASFLAGELELKGMLYFVKQQSYETDHSNSTIETALLKLGDVDASKNVAKIIFSNNKDSCATCLNQLNSINKDYIRYKVYNYIILQHPEKLGELMKLLAESKRNFDDDRRKIYETAKSLNITINDRDFVYESEIETIEKNVA